MFKQIEKIKINTFSFIFIKKIAHLYAIKRDKELKSVVQAFIGNQERTLEQLWRRDKWKLLFIPVYSPSASFYFPHLFSCVTKSFYWLSSGPRLTLPLSNRTPAKGVVFLTKLADLVYQLVSFLLPFFFSFWFLRTPILISSFSLVFFPLSCFPECSFSVLMRVRGKILRSFILVLSTEWERGI